MNKIKIMTGILGLIFPIFLFAQEKSIPLNVSLFNESTTIPYTSFFSVPIHPGLQIGTEFNYAVKDRTRLFQTANLSYFYHEHLAHGLALNSELGYEYRMKMGVALTALLGLGYMHTFATAPEYNFSNGVYEKVRDRGNARLYPSLSLDVGYYLKRNEPESPKLFVRYQSWAEYPYSPGFIPVMAHVNFHLGAKFFIKSKK